MSREQTRFPSICATVKGPQTKSTSKRIREGNDKIYPREWA